MEQTLQRRSAGGPQRGALRAPKLAGQSSAAGGVTQPTLAHIGPDIPVRISSSQGLRNAAYLAQWLLAAQVLPVPRHSVAPGDLAAYCQSSLLRWMHQRTGELRCLTPCFDMQLLTYEEMPPMLNAPVNAVQRVLPAGVKLTWCMSDVAHWGIGCGLDYLEHTVPMLGTTILETLERKGLQVCPLFSPQVVMDEACGLYWLGEEDETMYLEEECGDDEAAKEAMRQNMVTRADIDAAFPAWTLALDKPCLSLRALASLRQHACPYVRKAGVLVLALRKLATTGQYMPEWEAPFIGYGAVLCWHDGDLAVRVSDDCAQMAWQGDSSDTVGEVVFPLAAPTALRRWMENMRPNLRAIGLIDRLLWHLTERE
ncbi:PRTRC system protein F [Pseudoduganella rivuli]|nr:PRTRC system protein F [Pseudoduganella rivuli]